MKFAHIIDDDGEFVRDPHTAKPIKINASSILTKSDAQRVLNRIENEHGLHGLQYTCSHGRCSAKVHFREASKLVSGRRRKARSQTWVSADVKTHITNCPGPREREVSQFPHNALSLNQAIEEQSELMLFNLNVDTGQRLAEQFTHRANQETKDELWRSMNRDKHSYFSVTSLFDLAQKITYVYETGGKSALSRVHIAHHGDLIPFRNFIVRNNATNRMEIIQQIRDRVALRSRHCHSNKPQDEFAYGRPRLFMFESAQHKADSKHPNRKDRVRGWRYEVVEDLRKRVVFDQLYLNKVALERDDITVTGALVLARPFIPIHQKDQYPMVHWVIANADNVDVNPSDAMRKILCWNGQNMPEYSKQMAFDLTNSAPKMA